MPPFEHLTPIGWHDLWAQHRIALIAAPLAFFAILGLAVWLSLANRHLSAERCRALTLGKRLEREHAHLETLIQTIPDLVWLKDPDGVYLACNPRFEAFFGAPRQQIVGKTDHDFMPRDEADRFRGFDRRAMRADGPCTNEEWVTFARDGHRELLETTKVAMHDADGALIGVLGIGHDITERKRIEHDLRSITEYAAEGIWTSGLDHRYLYANPAALAMTGHTLEELQGMRIQDLVAPEEHARLAEHFTQMSAAGAVARRLWRLKRKDGSLLEVELTSQRLPDDRLLAVGRDLTHLRDHEEALFRAIYYDALTGLPNRTLMLERLEQSRLRACRDQTHLALGFLDLDRFGVVNEIYGHAHGDRILADIASRERHAGGSERPGRRRACHQTRQDLRPQRDRGGARNNGRLACAAPARLRSRPGIRHRAPDAGRRPLPAWVDAWHAAGLWRDLPKQHCTDCDATLVIAGIIHRRWFRILSAAVETGQADSVEIVDAVHCPFSKWYRGIGERRYADLPDFKMMDNIHRRAHRIAEEIVARLKHGDTCAARVQLPQLQATCNELLDHIDHLTECESLDLRST